MTRINTNVSSLTAQKTLAQSNAQLQQALTRLSTGLRINSGKDDPAGLIASAALGSDIVSTQKAISNSQRANQVIATADSGLSQVSSLLNDIRGLATEAANTGAMSADQIAANQLQVDSALDSLNRIAQVTSFQGRRLLDGSLDFITQAVSGMSTVSDMHVDSATLGTSGALPVSVDITTAAAQATATDTGVTAGTRAAGTLTFAPGAIFANAAANATIDIMSKSLTTGGNVVVSVAGDDAKAGTVEYDGSSNLTVYVAAAAGTITADALALALNASTTASPYFYAKVTSGGTNTFLATAPSVTTKSTTLQVQASATQMGATWNNVAIAMKVGNVGGTTPQVAYDSTNRVINVTIDATAVTTVDSIVTAIGNLSINGVKPFAGTKTITGASRQNVYGGAGADLSAAANTGNSGGNTLYDSLVVQVSGSQGSQVFNFGSGSTLNQVVDAVNAQSDTTGVKATMTVDGSTGNATLNLLSTAYGKDAFVATDVISEGTSGRFINTLSKVRAIGGDIVASVNGIAAAGKGNTLSVNTASLAMTATVANGSSTDFSFNITGGGAVFQLGPNVVSSQQSRIGISSVNTAKLGGTDGRLYELGSGGSAALAKDPSKASKIVDAVLNKVNLLRGRLGAFQKTTVETNINTLSDTVQNLTDAQSSIRDADFAAETAALTRAQILVQAGTSVLAVANQNPQNVLALLRNL